MSDSRSFKRVKMENIRSPFDNIFNIIGGLPQGHEKPLKHALYNAVAMLLLFLSCGVAWALYLILEPFIKPLVWALLVGSVLHPIKYNIAKCLRSWFEHLEKSSKPVILGVAMLPVKIINDTSDFIGGKLRKHIKLIAAFCIVVPLLHIIYFYTPSFCITLLWNTSYIFSTTVTWLIKIHSSSLMLILAIGYVTLLAVYWTPTKSTNFHYFSLVLWLFVSCYIAHFAGYYNVHAFIILQILFSAGFIIEVIEIHDTMRDNGKHISFMKSLYWAITNQKPIDVEVEPSDTTIEKKEKPQVTAETVQTNVSDEVKDEEIKQNPWKLELFENANKISEDEKKQEKFIPPVTPDVKPSEGDNKIVRPTSVIPPLKRRYSFNSPLFGYRALPRSFLESHLLSNLSEDEDTISSSFYLWSVIWACGVMLLWKNVILLPILPIPILIYITKITGNYFGLWKWIKERLNGFHNKIYTWCQLRIDALVPIHIRGMYKIIQKCNAKIEESLKDSIDTVSSIVVICGLIVFLMCASIFIFIQIYAEAIMLVQVGSNVINSTVVHNPELRQLLPPGWDDTMDSIIDNAYTYGREGISKALRNVMKNVEEVKVVRLEQQVLELWDRVYQSWVSANTEGADTIGPKVTSNAVELSWNAFLHDIQKSPEMFNISGIIEFLKQNVGTVMSLLESVWSILKGNISLVLGSFSAFVSVLLGGGTAVLNFILNIVVFLTTLFYLLSASGTMYKPVQLLSSVSPSNGSRFGHALEQAINGVFKASGKMAIFYGLWTWLMHNLFGVKIVYLPTALAAVLGAVPFLGTYWACLPAVLDLWLAQGETALACLLALCQFAPCAFIDATIYQEIKGGGHPYLTGLAIAGGIFWLGFEGAIFGPLLLCGLFVAVDLSSTLFKETPAEEEMPIRIQRLESLMAK